MTTVKVFAPAKINLTLHVTGQRDNGYHLLDSLVVFARDVGDWVSVAPSDTLALTVYGPTQDGVPTDESNLVLKAAKRLRALRGVSGGAAITLEKHLPNGGGIGGGTSDAAAAIKALAQLWNVDPLNSEEALPIGSDLPVCLCAPSPMRMHGIGELLDTVPPLPSFWLVLVNPRVHIPTGDVFRIHDSLYKAGPPPMEGIPSHWDFEDFHVFLLGKSNDLTKCAAELTDLIQLALESLRAIGCKDADMSGSGSTCWGLFETEHSAKRAAEKVARDHPEWWVRATPVS